MADPKQDETFRVIDRRLFNTDGEIRDEAARAERQKKDVEAPAAPAQPPAAQSTPAPAAVESGIATPAAAPETALDPPVDTNPNKPSRGLEMLINFVAQNAAMLLGAYPDPRTGQAMLDLEGARELIDMLDALHETTRGNLATEDDRLLLDVLGSLKLSFMEMTKAAAKAMQDKAKTHP